MGLVVRGVDDEPDGEYGHPGEAPAAQFARPDGREQDQQRESNAGKDLPPGYIKALQSYQKLNEKQTEQIKTVSPALNLYYKQKIKSYFDQLNVK